jgi:hypothetical protein
VTTLLGDSSGLGYGVPAGRPVMTFVDEVAGMEVEWTLGVALSLGRPCAADAQGEAAHPPRRERERERERERDREGMEVEWTLGVALSLGRPRERREPSEAAHRPSSVRAPSA